MNKGQFGMEQRSNAWYAVVDALDTNVEGWFDNGSTAIQAAVNTIELLANASKVEPEQDSEFTTDYAVVLTKEEVNQLLTSITSLNQSAGLSLARFFLEKVM